MRIRLLAGRDFTHDDDAAAAPVAIVNETLARQFWPGQDAIGRRLQPAGAAAPPIVVIGVARDSKYVTVGEEPRPFLYRPLAQAYIPRLTVLARGPESASLLTAITASVRLLDPGLAVFNATTLEEATSVSLLPARVAGILLAALGVFALVLVALGIYGVLSFVVRTRTREIGIRLAVGAAPRAVALMVVRQALTWCAAGGAIGLLLAVALSRILHVFLYGIEPTDPATIAAVTLLLAAVAGCAAFVPASYASRLNPVSALRHD